MVGSWFGLEGSRREAILMLHNTEVRCGSVNLTDHCGPRILAGKNSI